MQRILLPRGKLFNAGGKNPGVFLCGRLLSLLKRGYYYHYQKVETHSFLPECPEDSNSANHCKINALLRRFLIDPCSEKGSNNQDNQTDERVDY